MSHPSTAIARHPWPARLRRKQASEYLRERHGITLSPATLAKLAVVGGGPLSARTVRSPSMSWTSSMPSRPPASAPCAHRPATGGDLTGEPAAGVRRTGGGAEFDGGLSRAEAEQRALADIYARAGWLRGPRCGSWTS